MKSAMAFIAVTILGLAEACAAGPTGYGAIKLGMTKEEIEKLPSDGGISLAAPLTEYQYKYSKPQPGRDKYDALIASPASQSPLESVLSFEEGKLVELYINL